MAEIIDYSSYGFSKWLEKDTSLVSNFQDVQFYSTLNIDPDTGEPTTSQVSAGLSTVDTGKMSQPEIDQLLGNIRATQLTSGDISQPINLISGHIQSANFATGSTGWRIDSDGNLEANSATLVGSITATSGAIGGWTIDTTSIYTGTEDHSGYTANAGDLTIYSDGSDASIHAKNWYIDAAGILTCNNPVLAAIGTGTDIAIQGWSSTLIFTADDYRVVSWSSGNDEVIKLADSGGTIYTIVAGNTGNMAATTYIYLDIGASTTVLQSSTTYSDAVGAGKILLAVAKNNADTSSSATIQAFGGKGGQLLTVDEIAANSTSTNEFVSNTAQIKDAIITNAKITTLAVSKLIAGTIDSQAINLAAASADSVIKSGMTDFADGTNKGFILGRDYSDSDTAKFYIGDAADSTKLMYWDGTDLIVNDSPISMNTFFGDGEDGNVTINDAGTTTLTADKFYNNLTITNNSTLDPAGYRVFVKGKTTIDSGSKFGRDGGNGGNGGNGANGTNAGSTGNGGAAGSAGAAGATLGAGTIAGAVAPVAGGAGSNGGNGGTWANDDGDPSGNSPAGGNGVSTDPSINVLTAITCTGIGGDGGRGGDSGGSATGAGSGTPGAVGTVGTATIATTRPNTYAFITPLYNVGTTDKLLGAPGNGGSSGGTGGGGGGGNDGNPDTYGCGGGGGTGSGGQGGNGGVMIVVYSKLSGSGTITAALGTAGTKGATIGVKGAAGATPPSSQSAAGGGAGGGAGGNGSNGGMALLLSRIIVNNGTISCDAGNGGNGGDGGDGGTANYDGNATDGALGTDGKNGVVGKVIQLVV